MPLTLIQRFSAGLVFPDAEMFDIQDWRALILARLLRVVFALGLVATVLSAYAALSEGRPEIVVIDAIALVWVGILGWKRDISLRARAWNFIAVNYVLGCFFLHVVGVVAQIYLAAVPLMAALFLGRRPALWGMAVNVVTLMISIASGHADLHIDGFPALPMVQAATITLNFTFMSAILSYAISVLLDGLEEALERQRRMAYFDPLTGLPNRRMLFDRLDAQLGAARRSRLLGAVIYIDLDHFKNVNDARGHSVGDQLLREVGRRLSNAVRAEDTVARIGGDEFVIVLATLATEPALAAERALQMSERLRVELTQPFTLDDKPYNACASLGVTLLQGGGQTGADLLREADTAMYRAKGAGRNRIAFFEAAMQSEVETRLALENDLAHAIAEHQLEVYAQPQFSPDGALLGAELLSRWTHPDRGPVSPAVFIALAEQSGLILQLGEWVLRQGCLAAKRLQAAGSHAPISVNVSPRQFRQPGFVQQVRALLEETGAPASGLIFEVTEGLLIESFDDTVARMHELNAMGIRFSIDDFGTGYSSLAYLKKLPLFELKIDRSFVDDLPDDANDVAIVQMILAMAENLGLRVVAEGVETQAQADFLASQRCDAIQGYLFARPMPLQDWLEQKLASLAVRTGTPQSMP